MDYFCPAEFTCSSATSPSSSSPGVVSYNGKAPVSGVFESPSPAVRFQPNLHGISMDWTPEEQAILEEGLVKYASESSIVRYAKIAMHLDNKTIRDVALRCRWLTKRDVSKRRKEDINLTRKSKERKEKSLDQSVVTSHAVMQSGFSPYQMLNNGNGMTYNALSDVTWQLLRQNAQTFEQISANLATHQTSSLTLSKGIHSWPTRSWMFQVHENFGLLCQARDNISKILSNLSDPPNTGKHMPPLPVQVNEELANSILPASTLRMQ